MTIVVPGPIVGVGSTCYVCERRRYKRSIWESEGRYFVLCYVCAAQVLAWLEGWRP